MTVVDDFNRASLGSNWTIEEDTPSIYGNQLVASAAAKLWWNATQYPNDQTSSAKQYGTGWRGVVVRANGSGANYKGYVAWISGVGSGIGLRLGWHNGGGWGAYLDSISYITCNSGDILSLKVSGQDPNILLQCYVNGALVKSLAQGSFSDPTAIVATGQPGLFLYTSSAILDDFDVAFPLVIQDASHAHLADSPTLTAHVPTFQLTIADATHGHSSESLALVQHNILAIANASHGHSSESLALVQHNILQIQNAAHDHLADNVQLRIPGGMVSDGMEIGLFVGMERKFNS